MLFQLQRPTAEGIDTNIETSLYKTYGDRYLNFKERLHKKQKEKKEQANELDKKTEIISSLEALEGTIPADKLREVIDKTFPKNWVNREVTSISQRAQSVGEKLATLLGGLGADGEVVASASMAYESEKAEIVFYGVTSKLPMQYIANDFLTHELAHANDWESDIEMNEEERDRLLLQISERLDADDRHKSEYVESLTHRDKRVQKYAKAKEYFAEICAVYFSNPEILHVKDFEIVNAVVKKHDPEFDVKKTGDIRKQIMLELNEPYYAARDKK